MKNFRSAIAKKKKNTLIKFSIIFASFTDVSFVQNHNFSVISGNHKTAIFPMEKQTISQWLGLD